MTGQGHASRETDFGSFLVELRTVNNRGFKCTVRSSDSLSSLDSRIESLLRSLIGRGSVNVSVTWRRNVGETVALIDADVLSAYAAQVHEVASRFPQDTQFQSVQMGDLLQLPGVVVASRSESQDRDELFREVEATVRQAVDHLNQMRAAEGKNMVTSLMGDAETIAEHVKEIADLAPNAAENYRVRLEGKIQRVLAQHEIEVPVIDLLREVQIYADRADVSEEVTRLGSHLEMLRGVLDGTYDNRSASVKQEPTGRKLEFIIQEMLRETNTIGSKASDTEVSAHVVEIKCAIERMRELVQNLE